VPNKDVFCNSPWYELHIFWDGSFGYCCAQTPHRPYPEHFSSLYNIKTMSISEWQNSKPMKLARLSMHTDTKNELCNACWYQEEFGKTSRRHKSNSKSVLFKQAFDESFAQSPNYDVFNYSIANEGLTKQLPVDLHIDLGNYCNLTCKFCCPEASSKISRQYSKWGLLDNQSVAIDWTKDEDVWSGFLEQVISIPEIRNIHFMGGETLITPRFEDFIDELIKHNRCDIRISFVTNGTSYNSALMTKLSKFIRVGIEISIETLTKHNEYIRQGTKNSVVIGNINKYIKLSTLNRSINVVIRPAVSLLSIGYYHTLLKFCLDNKLVVKSNNVIREVGWNSTKCLDVCILPTDIKNKYKAHYENLINDIDVDVLIDDFNESDPHNYKNIIKDECIKCISMLEGKSNPELYPDMIELLSKWDKLYCLNAIDLYPEMRDLLIAHGYNNES